MKKEKDLRYFSKLCSAEETPIRTTHAVFTLFERMIPTSLCYLISTSGATYSVHSFRQYSSPPTATWGGMPIFTPSSVFTHSPLIFTNKAPKIS